MPSLIAACSPGISSVSHQACFTRYCAEAAIVTAARKNQAQRSDPRAVAVVKLSAHRAIIDIHRQGNCTKRSSGKNRHRTFATGNIKTMAENESTPSKTKRSDFTLPAFAREKPRHAVNAAQIAHKARSIAMCDAMRLNASCSASDVFA